MAANPKVDYGTYMASREWRLKRKEVIAKTAGWCSRCHSAKATQVHHLTYERLGSEEPEDLRALCRSCHEFLSAECNIDPAYVALLNILREGLEADGPPHESGFPAWWRTRPLPSGCSFEIQFDGARPSPHLSEFQYQITDALWIYGWVSG